MYHPLLNRAQPLNSLTYQDYVVELDVVMNRDTPLWKAHDLSQALQVRPPDIQWHSLLNSHHHFFSQDKLEELPRVDRGLCFGPGAD